MTLHAHARRSVRAIDGNALRAGVLGANDGLVSNFSLVMGVAGASAGGEPVLIAGIAGLLAGSLSMALGEWLSVQSSRELYQNRIAAAARELDQRPAGVIERVASAYELRGLKRGEARDLAGRILRGDRAAALDVIAREDFAVDPADLGGSAWTAANTSFVLFAVGAAVPVVPFVFSCGVAAIAVSAILSGTSLFALGATITRMTGRHPLWAGARQLGFGLVAAAITFGTGTLLGTALG